MNAKSELVQNWLVKARHDLAAARKLASDPDPYLDIAIYHCQQAAEKAIKGFLAFHDRPLQRTHDVGALVTMALQHDAGFSEWVEAAALLTPYATEFRYPGIMLEPSPKEFAQALSAAEGLCSFVLSVLPSQVLP